MNSVIHADVLNGLAQLDAGLFHCVINSPPYWRLRSYPGVEPTTWADGQVVCLGAEADPESFVRHLVQVYDGVRRVLRDDGVLFVNLGETYANSGGRGEQGGSGQRSDRTFTCVRDASQTPPVGLKPGDRCGIPERFALAMQEAGWWWRDTIVWCLSAGTMIYARTAKGDAPASLKDLARLDPSTVQLWNGEKWTRVVSWTRTRKQKGTIIELRNGEKIRCTAGHVWPTTCGNKRTDELSVGDVIRMVRLPEPDNKATSLCVNEQEMGWIAGFYMAEGAAFDKGVRFTIHESEVAEFERIRAMAESFGGTAQFRHVAGKTAVVDVYSKPLREMILQYVSGTGSKGKRLSRKAWARGNDFLAAFLQGYLDGDGGWEEKAKRWRLGFTLNHGWASDLRTLCARLGKVCRIRQRMHSCQTGKFKGYRGSITEHSGHHNKKQNGEIVAIYEGKTHDFYDVEVEDEPHLFALASGVLTHNSKRSPMPSSQTGWRWMQCRGQKIAGATTKRAGKEIALADGRDADEQEGCTFQLNTQYTPAQYEPCPGCDKCRDNDGLVLRKGRFRTTTAHEPIFMFAKSPRYFCDDRGAAEAAVGGQPGNKNHKGAAAYANGDEHHRTKVGLVDMVAHESRNPRSVWSISTEPSSEKHFAAYPTNLVKKLMDMATSQHGCCAECGSPYAPIVVSERIPTRPGKNPKEWKHDNLDRSQSSPNRDPQRHIQVTKATGYKATCKCDADVVPCRVLDPFGGTGTTARVAHHTGRDWCLIEASAEYLEIIPRNIARPLPSKKAKGKKRRKVCLAQGELF